MNFFFERNLNEMISSLSNENNNFKRNFKRKATLNSDYRILLFQRVSSKYIFPNFHSG